MFSKTFKKLSKKNPFQIVHAYPEVIDKEALLKKYPTPERKNFYFFLIFIFLDFVEEYKKYDPRNPEDAEKIEKLLEIEDVIAFEQPKK